MHGEEILERSEISIRHFSVTPKLCTVDDARPCARDLVTLDALIDSLLRIRMKDALNSTTQPSRRLASQRAKNGAKHVSRGGMTLFPELDGSSRDALRRAFFGGAALLAQRFGVTDEDIAIHLERVAARASVQKIALPLPSNIADLVLATACTRVGSTAASLPIATLRIEMEPILKRTAALRVESEEAILVARRFWLEFERATLASASGGIQEYNGARPLRVWIADQLLGRLERSGARVASARDNASAPRTTLRLVGA